MAQLSGAALIAQRLGQAPLQPGVYLMKNAGGNVIYVGKAKALRKRLANYARVEEFPGYYRQKVQAMSAQVHSLEWVVTASEKEALILESNLIKLHKPRYNVDLRDDKTYPYFRLSLQDNYPRFHLVRRPDRSDGALYWGPLENVGAARSTLDMLHKSFPLRRCSNRQMNNRSRPCLNYEMKRCLAPCVGRVDEQGYRQLVLQIKDFFSGQGEKVVGQLEKAMLAAAENENFEQAAALRDRLFALKRTLENQRMDTGEGDLDAWGIYEDETSLRMAIVRMRGGQIIASQVQDFSQAALNASEALSQGMLTFYTENNPPPPLILLSLLPDDASLVGEEMAGLRQGKVELRLPQRGDKRQLLDLALKNAAMQQEMRESERQVLASLGAKLGQPHLERMECIDISHLGGDFTVASVVCFVGGKPHKADYRRYRLHDIPAGDDYAAMSQAFTRRLNSKRPWPDMIVVDGGKGQLAMAVAAYKKYEQETSRDVEQKPGLLLASLAKGEQNQPDKLYLPERKNPLNFRPRDPTLAMVMHLRDEAHRVAIGYQRLLRKKAFTRSLLDEIDGLGPKSKKKIWQAFGSLKELRQASAHEISVKAGINLKLAEKIKQRCALHHSNC